MSTELDSTTSPYNVFTFNRKYKQLIAKRWFGYVVIVLNNGDVYNISPEAIENTGLHYSNYEIRFSVSVKGIRKDLEIDVRDVKELKEVAVV